MMCR